MSQQSASQLLKQMEDGGMEGAEQLQPTMISHLNINLEKVEQLWSGHLNDAEAPKIDQKISEGFVAFRIQTEFRGIQYGHATMVYMAKMR